MVSCWVRGSGGATLAAAPAVDAAPLRLDATLGKGGIARLSFRAWTAGLDGGEPAASASTSAGRQVARGGSHARDHGNTKMLLARFTRGGRPDATFGHGGREQLGYHWTSSRAPSWCSRTGASSLRRGRVGPPPVEGVRHGGLTELLPARDGGLVIIGSEDNDQRAGQVARRIALAGAGDEHGLALIRVRR